MNEGSLQAGDLRVLQNISKGFDARHVLAFVGQGVAGEAEECKNMGPIRCVTTPTITHVQKASTAPQRSHIALLECLAESCDALCGVGAAAKLMVVTKGAVLQAANIASPKCEMNRYRTTP